MYDATLPLFSLQEHFHQVQQLRDFFGFQVDCLHYQFLG
jgi:hypothetical protein